MKTLVIIILSSALSSCTTDIVSTDLSGRWVYTDTMTDTLTFRLIGGHEYMILGRGKELRDGFLRPKSGSGPYQYKLLQDDTIQLRWFLSSNSNFNAYYFKQVGGILIMDDFFDTKTYGTKLTFAKLPE